jgi:exosortase
LIQGGSRSVEWVRLGFLLVLAVIAYHGLAFWDPRSHGFSAVVGWFFETSDSSPQVIFAIVAALLFQRRRELREALGCESAPALAALSLVPAVALHLWAQWVDAPDLSVVSLGLVVLGVGLLLGGRPLGRLLVAPLALLVFAIPLPGALHNFVVYPYQLTTAGFVERILHLYGHEVMLQGDVLTLAGREFEVIETCSGLRSALTLALLASAWAVFFRCSLRHALGLLAASLAIAFVTNGIRVLVLVLDPRPEIQESHVTQGVVMFVVGTGLLSLVDRALIRLGASEAKAEPAPPAARADARSRLHPAALALFLMAAATLVLPGLRPAAPAFPPPQKLPRHLPGWAVREGQEPGQFFGNVRFTHRSNLVYERGLESVAVFLGSDDRRLRIRSLLSDKNAVPGYGWQLERRRPIELEPRVGPMERVEARRFADRSLTVHAYRGTGSVLEESLRAALALDQPGSPFARPIRARVLRLSTAIDPGPDGGREAEERLRSLLTELAAVLVW